MADTMPSPRHSPTAFAIRMLGLVPHARQSEFLECRAPVKVAACGRRWGKSLAGAVDALWFAVTRPGSRQFVVGPTADQARIIWDQARRLAEEGELAGAVTRVVESPFPELSVAALTLDGREVESIIAARSVGHDAKYLRGHGADRVIVDEAAYVPEQVLTHVIPPMLASSEYRELVLLSTPFGLNHFYDYFRRGQLGDWRIQSFQFPTHTNPHIAQSYLEQQRGEMTELAFRVEYLAEFTEDQASVFRHSIIQSVIDPTLAPGSVEGRRYVIGYDPAKYADRSGVVVLDHTEKPYQVVEVLDISGRDYVFQAYTILQLSQAYNQAGVLMDATSHAQLLEQLRLDGVPAGGLRFTNEVKQQLIDGLVIAMEKGDVRIPQHADLLRELSYYRFERTTAGRFRLGAPARAGMHDDLVTALALAVQGGIWSQPQKWRIEWI